MHLLFDPLFDRGGYAAHFSDAAWLEAMLRFEVALARAACDCGLLPEAAAQAIEAAAEPSCFDAAALGREAISGGNPAIPLVAALRRRVAAIDGDAARFVHFGATSQDVVDTALILCARAAWERLAGDLRRLLAALLARMETHPRTLRVARTLLQHALPTRFALELALLIDALLRHRERMAQARDRIFALQLGGAVGTRAAFGAKAREVGERLAAQLGLSCPLLPWHTSRDRILELAFTLAGLASLLAKMHRDVALSAQNELGELHEPAKPARGSSSTLPHKRNPIGATLALAAYARMIPGVSALLAAAPQEFARGVGGWHAEWHTVAQLFVATGHMLALAIETIAGLEVDEARMAANLEHSLGLVFAEAVRDRLAAALGYGEARRRIDEACARVLRERRPLREVLMADPALRPHLDESLFDPESQLVAADLLIEETRRRAHRALAEKEKPDG